MSPEEVREKSEKITRRLLSFEPYIKAKTALLYLSSFNEPSTHEILSDALKTKRVAVPISDTVTNTLSLSYIGGFEDLEKGAYGILEPKKIIEADISEMDFILVPGIAFDRNGNRMGFGKGYYDKLLCKTTAEKTALCYEFQLIQSVPREEHDIKMNTIITEDNIYAV